MSMILLQTLSTAVEQCQDDILLPSQTCQERDTILLALLLTNTDVSLHLLQTNNLNISS